MWLIVKFIVNPADAGRIAHYTAPPPITSIVEAVAPQQEQRARMSVKASPFSEPIYTADSAVPALRECVARSLRSYLRSAGDETAGDLYRLVMNEVEAPMLREVLRHTDGNLSRAAGLLGISRATLRKKIAEHTL